MLTTRLPSKPGVESDQGSDLKKTSKTMSSWNPATAGNIYKIDSPSPAEDIISIMLDMQVSQIKRFGCRRGDSPNGFGFLPVGPVNRWSSFKF